MKEKVLKYYFYAITILQILWTINVLIIITFGTIIETGARMLPFREENIINTLQWFSVLGISIISYAFAFFSIKKIPNYTFKYVISILAYIPTFTITVVWIIIPSVCNILSN